MNIDRAGRVTPRPAMGKLPAGPASHGRRGPASPRQAEASPADRQAARVAAAEQSLADLIAQVQAMGVDPDRADTALAVLRDCIARVRECDEYAQRELSMAGYEWGQARRRRMSQRPETVATPVLPDAPGFGLCPNPDAVRTPDQFVDTLRMYRIWAGKPSYRVMQRRCGSRFAASTICTALHGDDLPSLDMVQVVIRTCGGTEEHRHAFVRAWQRLMMSQEGPSKPPLGRSFYPVGETA